MQPHEERVVVAEKKELDEKLDKLRRFFYDTIDFQKLPPTDQWLLQEQFTAMRKYSKILGLRIDRFQGS